MAEVRPIDANALIKKLLSYQIMSGGVLQDIRDQPTIDYAPVRHGEWRLVEDDHAGTQWLQCSECWRRVLLDDSTNFTSEDLSRLTKQYPYCHCGAKMEVHPND